MDNQPASALALTPGYLNNIGTGIDHSNHGTQDGGIASLQSGRRMKITEIESHVLLAPNANTKSASSAQDSFIVIVRTDECVSGIGESDVNPWIAGACVDAPGTHTMGVGIKQVLIGENPLDRPNLAPF